ncbi:MAG: RNA polymerase subunit sigma-24 [Phycisphaeraceae bacterium]|nr:RNA polymerase subunit sigma-24 [Phycisphaeraceae bacterium]
MTPNPPVNKIVEQLYQTDSRQVYATLVRLIGDFDLAEEAMHEAFAAAMLQWEDAGIPDHPTAWLISTGRFKAIDMIRRRERFDASMQQILSQRPSLTQSPLESLLTEIPDDQLRLIFTCCHPSLAIEAQLALTLREVCGLTTEQVASAFLISPATLAQRIVRAKAKIKTAGIPYEIPDIQQMPQRLDAVLHVIYLLFNEGYNTSSGEHVTAGALSDEAIRLGSLLLDLQSQTDHWSTSPDADVMGLLALMLLQTSRRRTRTDEHGDIVLLEDQDRSQWDQDMIRQGVELVEQAMATGEVGSYTIQAAIAAEHARASDVSLTNWGQIVRLYDVLLQIQNSPVIALNRAVAIAMRDGPEIGLTHLEAISGRGELAEYYLYHAARADLCRRLERYEDAHDAYERALSLTQQEPEQRYLQKRLEEISKFM